ncbi:hypothetical protein [Bacillus atrophaeus]|uniref:hypothetical protein n=1 Tax=Bacillus atrophaeus TaxID=1452 RepID=UPI002E1D9463|nr:hypothetical protein [Bacillus atrophaeus]MED1031036.1 hypothetical protein [Bacillus atrophaeus]MED1120230.1 hypothetical protein [Bacillus atrophaeus]MED1132687.1 hypothetical protein [Bacillus atrophaeus]
MGSQTVETIIQLEKELEIVNSNSDKIVSLQREQAELIDKLIDENNEVIRWLYENRLPFFHETIQRKTSKGPILGFDKDEDRLIRYNFEKHIIESLDIYDTSDLKEISSLRLVRDGHFVSAVKGIKYLTKQQKEIIDEQNKTINKLNYELESAKKDFGTKTAE